MDDFALYDDVYGTWWSMPTPDSRSSSGRDGRLAAFQRNHPGVEVVCRDGSLQCRQGISDGAPNAIQVSDRFQAGRGHRRHAPQLPIGCSARARIRPFLQHRPI
ncbi:hypothetical protein H9Y04_44440 [Streptomyces sp. TRM66268-LWL]|uniref:Uncharacterized protein n=1 Tax=Streptomyces polyasparticus TaxID=2767826 RepID=A0ABR7SXP7_9ACTN|nr:hypothetical protein [Streptomyces polyasparticus]MBC9719559.1 hypothetical protein [Streptomyces polyasparticus]